MDYPIVGIGASAGGIEALGSFFNQIGDNPQAAFVVILHLDPERESNLAEALSRSASIPVSQVTERTPLEMNHVYVIPPARELRIGDDHLDLSEFEEPRGKRAPIDHFFRSLAALEEDSVGIILSGGGTDGTVGIKAIKEAGGIVMAQSPDEAAFSGMPRSAVGTGIIDFILPVAELAKRVLDIVKQRKEIDLPDTGDLESLEQNEVLQSIFSQLRARTGHDFSQYKRTTALRRLGRRLQVTKVSSLEEYLDLLRDEEDEAEALLKDLLISVTSFFRDTELWEKLEETILPELLAGFSGEQIRVWSVGCATGEEAYSLGILLRELVEDEIEEPLEIQIFATDIDEEALSTARAGKYPSAIEADVSTERLKRFFRKEGDHYSVRQDIRERVLFAPHSLLKDPPFSRIDLITCRHLLIYLNAELQQSIFQVFHYALKTSGLLVLGSAETADSEDQLFNCIDKKHRIYRSRSVTKTLPVMKQIPTQKRAPGEGRPKPASRKIAHTTENSLHSEMLDEHAPPNLLVNSEYEVIHLSENAGRYLLHPSGKPTTNILQLVRPELRADLQTGLHRAFSKGESLSTGPLRVQFNGETGYVHLLLQPGSVDNEELALVFFAEVTSHPKEEEPSEEKKSARVQELEAELTRTKDRLQATIEEYESTREEMTAANEELQSINEEYKSTGEELETSKEELQSVNEELQTVNQELKDKVEQLSKSNSDLHNLIVSTDIATLFLSRDLRIKRYTERVKELFNIQKEDIGRPIHHLTHALSYNDLEGDCNKVMDDLSSIEREVQDSNDQWFLLRLRPYRTLKDQIDGVVITFVDITERKKASLELEKLADELEEKVGERTRELVENNQRLEEEIKLRQKLEKEVSQRLIEEQKMIGRELHDSLGQTLVAVRLLTETLKRKLKGKDSGVEATVDDLFEEVKKALGQVRSIALGLAISKIDSQALSDAFKDLIDAMPEPPRYHLDFEGEMPVRDSAARVHLYHIAQEAVTNAIKHSKADDIWISLHCNEDRVLLEVKDNGTGFSTDSEDIGIGLQIMKHRARLIDGDFGIDSAPGKGTVITCSFEQSVEPKGESEEKPEE